MTGHQFEYNLAAWFVPALFLVEMANVLLRRVLGKAADNEYAVTAVYMGIGIGGISLSLSGRFEQGWLTLVRMMFLLPCYQWGTLYRQKLEDDMVKKLVVFFVCSMYGSRFLVSATGKDLFY